MSSQTDGQQHPPLLIAAAVIGRDFFKLCNNPTTNAPPVPVNDFLVPMVQLYANQWLGADHKIVVEGASWSKNRINSMLYREEKQSLILVHHSLNWCYTRFAATVELANILTARDEKETTTDVVALLKELRAAPAIFVDPAPSTPHYAEMLAILVSIELLTPMCYRDTMDRLIKEGRDAQAIAEEFRIPLYVAEWLIDTGWKQRTTIHDQMKDV